MAPRTLYNDFDIILALVLALRCAPRASASARSPCRILGSALRCADNPSHHHHHHHHHCYNHHHHRHHRAASWDLHCAAPITPVITTTTTTTTVTTTTITATTVPHLGICIALRHDVAHWLAVCSACVLCTVYCALCAVCCVLRAASSAFFPGALIGTLWAVCCARIGGFRR